MPMSCHYQVRLLRLPILASIGLWHSILLENNWKLSELLLSCCYWVFFSPDFSLSQHTKCQSNIGFPRGSWLILSSQNHPKNAFALETIGTSLTEWNRGLVVCGPGDVAHLWFSFRSNWKSRKYRNKNVMLRYVTLREVVLWDRAIPN